LKYCREHFNSGGDFYLGVVLESEYLMPESTSRGGANGYEMLKRGDKVVAFASQGAMVCVQGLQAANPIWVPKKSIAIAKRDVVASKSTWAGIWQNSGGNWFVVSPNFNNSVTIVDGRAFNAGAQSYGMLRGLVGSTKDDLSGMARSLLFKESPVLSDKLSPRQIETLRDSVCRFDGFLLDDVIVIYNQQGSCGGMSINFDGIYRRAEKYPIPGVVNTEQRKFSHSGRPQV
jgi:hypothetical protein